MPKPSRVRPADRAAWRAWLAKHHATATEVTLEFAKKAAPKPTVTYAEAVEEALCFGWIDGVKNSVDAHHYSHRFTPRRPKSLWSAINKQRVAAMIACGAMHPAGLAVIDAAKADGTWDKQTNADAAASIDVDAPELVTALAKSAPAKRAYDALTNKQQKLYRRYVSEAKRVETRLQRAASAVDWLRAGKKQPFR